MCENSILLYAKFCLQIEFIAKLRAIYVLRHIILTDQVYRAN